MQRINCGNLRNTLRSILSSNDIQYRIVRQRIRIIRLLRQSRLESLLGFLQSSQMNLGDGLSGDGGYAGGGGGSGELLENVVRLLVGFSADAEPDPGRGNVDEDVVLSPVLAKLDDLLGEVGAVVQEVDLNDEGDSNGCVSDREFKAGR